MRFFYVRLRTYAQYASMNEFTCSEHSVRIHRLNKRITGSQPWDLRLFSSDAFFLRTFTYVCSIRVNERIYVFWALRTYTYVKKDASLENSLSQNDRMWIKCELESNGKSEIDLASYISVYYLYSAN